MPSHKLYGILLGLYIDMLQHFNNRLVSHTFLICDWLGPFCHCYYSGVIFVLSCLVLSCRYWSVGAQRESMGSSSCNWGYEANACADNSRWVGIHRLQYQLWCNALHCDYTADSFQGWGTSTSNSVARNSVIRVLQERFRFAATDLSTMLQWKVGKVVLLTILTCSVPTKFQEYAMIWSETLVSSQVTAVLVLWTLVFVLILDM